MTKPGVSAKESKSSVLEGPRLSVREIAEVIAGRGVFSVMWSVVSGVTTLLVCSAGGFCGAESCCCARGCCGAGDCCDTAAGREGCSGARVGWPGCCGAGRLAMGVDTSSIVTAEENSCSLRTEEAGHCVER